MCVPITVIDKGVLWGHHPIFAQAVHKRHFGNDIKAHTRKVHFEPRNEGEGIHFISCLRSFCFFVGYYINPICCTMCICGAFWKKPFLDFAGSGRYEDQSDPAVDQSKQSGVRQFRCSCPRHFKRHWRERCLQQERSAAQNASCTDLQWRRPPQTAREGQC